MADEKEKVLAEEISDGAEETVAKDAKSVKDGKSKKKNGLGKRFVKYLRDLKGEFKKIAWPTVPAVVKNTGITLAMCLVLGVCIWVIDIGLGALINALLAL